MVLVFVALLAGSMTKIDKIVFLIQGGMQPTKGFTFSSNNFRMVALFFVSVYMSGRILEVQQQVCSFTVSGWW